MSQTISKLKNAFWWKIWSLDQGFPQNILETQSKFLLVWTCQKEEKNVANAILTVLKVNPIQSNVITLIFNSAVGSQCQRQSCLCVKTNIIKLQSNVFKSNCNEISIYFPV